MSYLVAIRDFCLQYDIFLLPAAFLLVWVFGIVNFCKNTYRKQNKKLNLCRAQLLKNNCNVSAAMCNLPTEYRRQWRAYVGSGAEKPSQTFEFAPKKNKKVGIILVILGALIAAVYLAIFVADTTRRDYLVFQIAFYLALCVTLVVNKLLFRRKEKRARQTFGKFVAQLNAVVASKGRNAVAGQRKDTVAEQIKQVKRKSVGNEAIEKASQILRQNGLNANRTAYEQRQINYALNGLLQAYSRKT